MFMSSPVRAYALIIYGVFLFKEPSSTKSDDDFKNMGIAVTLVVFSGASR